MAVTGTYLWPTAAYYSSSDGGRHWTGAEDFLFYDSTHNRFSPQVVSGNFPVHGGWNALYATTVQTFGSRYVNLAASSDAGATWNGIVVVGFLGGMVATDLQVAVDKYSNTQYRNDVYLAWTELAGNLPYQIRFARASDFVFGWDTSFTVISNMSLPHSNWMAVGVNLLVLDNGHILAFWALRATTNPRTEFALCFNKSTNGGHTWGNVQIIVDASQRFAGIGPRIKEDPTIHAHAIYAHSHPTSAVDRSGGPNHGRIVVAWANQKWIPGTPSEDQRHPGSIWLISSTDNGHTWSSPFYVEKDQSYTDQWHPRVIVDHTGEVNIVFYDSSIDPDSNNYTQVTLARTTNGSLLTEHWRHYQISDFAWIPVPVPSTPEGFAGEYIGLAANSRYVIPVWNDNRTGAHEVYVARFPIERTSVASTLQEKWNMKSIPVIRDDFGAASVFPNSSVYRYEPPNYVLSDTLTCLRGYWVNTPQPQNVIHAGGIVEMMGMPVVPGGNIIGSITSPVPAATVWSNPPGILTNPVFYRYDNGGYHPSKTLQPGEAYCVLANASGTIYLEAGFSNDPTIDDILAEYDRFTITDSAGNTQDIYVRNGSMVTPGAIGDLEMPPPPPEFEFDARFATGQFLRTVDPDSGIVHLDIAVDTAQYPITLSWDINPESGIEYEATINNGGLGKAGQPPISLRSVGAISIPREAGKTLALTGSATRGSIFRPQQYGLRPNFPNPFNPSTTITYDLAEDCTIELQVFDVLGRAVQTLIAGHQRAGTHSVVWNGLTANGVAAPSGVYIIRLGVNTRNGTALFTQKTLLLK